MCDQHTYFCTVVFLLGQFIDQDNVGKVRKYSEYTFFIVKRVKNADCFHKEKQGFSRQIHAELYYVAHCV